MQEMAVSVLLLLKRIVYLVITGIGLSMATSAYPPPAGELPVLLLVGAALTVAGIVGVIWPEKITSGSAGPD
jgi:hypothetical protein